MAIPPDRCEVSDPYHMFLFMFNQSKISEGLTVFHNFLSHIYIYNLMTFHMQVFWKLDSFENSLRMRKRLRRNYKGLDHQVVTSCKESSLVDFSSDGIPLLPGALELVPENIKTEETGDNESKSDDERGEEGEYSAGKGDMGSSGESVGPSGSASAEQTIPSSAAPVTSTTTEPKEVLLLETLGVMIKPLKIQGGTFQVATTQARKSLNMYIIFVCLVIVVIQLG